MSSLPETSERMTLDDTDELEAQAWFRARGLTDGLPIILPSVERVERVIERSGFDRRLELGPVEPSGGVATVENVDG